MKALLKLKNNFLKYKRYLLAGTLFIILSNLFAVFIPPIVREAVNAIANLLKGEPVPDHLSTAFDFFDTPEKVALFFGALIVLSAVLKGLFMYFMRQTIIVMSRYIEFDLKNDIFKHYQNLGQRFYGSNYTGDLMNRISEDVSRVRDFAGPAVMYAINLFFMIAMVLSIMFYVNTPLTLLVLIPLPILAITIYLVSDAMNKRSDIIQKKLSVLTSQAQESFSGIQVIKAFAAEDDFQRDFDQHADEYKHTNMDLVKINAWFMPAVLGLVGLSVLITVYAGGRAVIDGTFTVGNIAEFVIYVYMLTWPVASLGYITSLVQRAAASMARISEFLSVEPDTNTGDLKIDELKEGISFEHVYFSYDGSEDYVLKDVNFYIPAGSKFGIIGTTGSGKSTIAKLLIGVYEPVKGEILIDGIPIQQYDRNSLRRLFGYVAQDIFLFSDTIRENILFGINVNDDTERLEQAIKTAALDEEIDKFPNKLETMLGERGITLSGGQKQRTAIARALIKQPQILLIDDGLSAVDTKTEVKIKSELAKVSSGSTFINISHRISSVQDAHQIIFLHNGVVVESGNHSSLMEKNGLYSELYARQLLQAEEEEL